MHRVVLAGRGGAEQLQALDAVSTTQIDESGGVLANTGFTVGILQTR